MGAMKLFDGGVTPYSAPTQRRPQERLGGLRYSFDGLANVENEMSSLLLFATAIPPPVTLVLKMNLSLFMFCQGFITHIFFQFKHHYSALMSFCPSVFSKRVLVTDFLIQTGVLQCVQ